MNVTVWNLISDLGPLEATVAMLGGSVLGAVLVEVVGIRLARRLVTRTDSQFDNLLLEELRWPIVVTIALTGVWALSRTEVLASTVLPAEQVRLFLGLPATSIVVLVWALALNNVVNRFVDEIDTSKRYDFAPVFSNVWTLVVFVGAGFLLLKLWGIEITPLLGAAGVAGIAVGFAAKDTVANFFGGIALYADDTYKIGDYVVLDSGEAGTVVEVGIRSTTLMTRDELLVTVPNSVLNATKIVNESAPGRRRRIRVPIGVAYGTDVDEFESIVLEVTAAEKLVLDSPKPRMRFRQFGDSALEYELQCWIASPTRRAKAVHRLNKGIYTALYDAGIEIPFPQREVSVRGANGARRSDSGPAAIEEPPIDEG